MMIAKKEQVKELKQNLTNIATEAYRKTLDKELLAMWDKEKFKPFMQWTCSANFIGPGLNHDYVDLVKSPAVNGSRPTVELDKDTANSIVLAKRAYETKNNEVKDLEKTLEIVIYKLASRKNIEKHLPEALEHLPADNSNTALSVDLSNLRAKLK